ncbi:MULTISPECIES: methyltransferase domain-containing protein [unclassified Streptomyces]|uniref:class I SAM-dependent methyltransferase n=1 Tax=unclassified Streptomyces TaxID=2593676 RepID=UPI000380E0B1|nr:methyltransferase domain-containing protein [Streptomyces sp. BoleA5]
MSGTAGGPDPVLAERTQPNGAPRRTRTTGLPPGIPARPGEPWSDDPYAHALRTGRGPLFLRRLSPPPRPYGTAEEADQLLPLDVERWCAVPDAADTVVLNRCTGPVLDVGCGPGRLVCALAARGVRALGVDVSPAAVARTRRHGGSAVRRSVFDRLPGEGRWGSVLLLDGNIGIGGDPFALLARLRTLVAPGGRLLAEAAPRVEEERLTVRVEDSRGRHGRPFPWARVGSAVLLSTAEAAGWTPAARWTAEGRPFVELHRPRSGHRDACLTAAEGPGRP